jgi:hypothetical protein
VIPVSDSSEAPAAIAAGDAASTTSGGAGRVERETDSSADVLGAALWVKDETDDLAMSMKQLLKNEPALRCAIRRGHESRRKSSTAVR